MGRRSAHTSEELREIILLASTDLIRESGFSGLSAREIARRVNYSPGTLYNVFENLDELVLIIEGRLLDSLILELASIPSETEPCAYVHAVANRYLKFSQENPKLWNLLGEHRLADDRQTPAWYQQKLDQLLEKVEGALAPFLPHLDPQALRRSARVLWASIHGIASFSTTDKLSRISGDTAADLLNDLITHYLAGLKVEASSRSMASA